MMKAYSKISRRLLRRFTALCLLQFLCLQSLSVSGLTVSPEPFVRIHSNLSPQVVIHSSEFTRAVNGLYQRRPAAVNPTRFFGNTTPKKFQAYLKKQQEKSGPVVLFDFEESLVKENVSSRLAFLALSRSLAQARGIRAKFSVFAQRMRLWKEFRETKAIETGFALFAGLTRNDVEAQAKVLTLNPAALRIIEELKAISKSSGVNVAIISRSMQEMIQAFLARPEIQAELRQHGITVCAVAANESHFDRNVMRGLKPGAAGISLATKRNYIGQFYLYVTDKKERDLQGAHRTVFIEDFSLPEPGVSAQNQLYKLYREPQLTFEGTSGMRGSAEAVITASPYLAAALAEVLKKQHRDLNQKIIYVGYDSRESSPLIAQTAAAVFASYGLIVHFISVPTQSPVLANLLGLEKHNPDLVGGVMITGSHNPTPDNGFCPRQPDGAVMIEGMSDVYREFMRLYRTRDIAVPSGEFERYYAGHKIRAVNDAGDTYVNRVLKENPLLTRIMSRMKTMGIDPGALTIMYDPLKGSGAYIMPRVLSEFGFGVKVIDENGTIIRDPLDYAPVIRRIDRVPHPTRKMEESWENVVRNNGAPVDLILSNDGDADRFAVVEGEFIDWNELFVLLIDYLGQAGLLDGYTHIVSTYTTSDALTRIAQKYGLDVERVPVGFKHVSRKIGELRRQGYKVLAGFEGNGGMVLCNGTVGIDKDGVLANLIFSCIAAECKYYAMTLRGRIREAQRNADMGLDFGYMQELQVPLSGTGITYIRNLRKIRKDDEFLGRTVSRVVVSNPEALPELREVKIVFNNGSWLIMRPSGTSLDRARIYAEAETTGSRDVLILDILRDYCEATGNFSFERILRYLREWLLTDFTPEQAGRIVHAVRQGGWDQARDLLVESRHAQVMRNRDEMVVDSLERLFAQRGGEAVAEHLLDLRRHSLSGYEQIRALLANTYSSPVFAHMARLFVATIDSADLYGINISEMSFQGVCNAVAGQIFNDIISVRAVRGPTRLLLENERTAQKMQRMLYTLLASNDYLIFSDPHATYRSVAELLASFPTAIPVVIGDVTYRGNRLFELQDLLEKNQAKLIFGEKEFWTIGGCLGNPFLTALSIASELRYNNFDMLNKLGIDFNVLMDFADAEPKYTSKNIADLKKRLPGGMNSIYEQAMFNIRLKLDPLRSPREKALLLARIPEEYLILKTGNFNVRERALMAKVRGDLTLSAGDLSPEEQDVLLSMFRREYGLSEREQAVLNSLRINFVASPQARSLVLSFLEHFKLFDVIEPSPLMRKIDETMSGFPGITWNKHPTAIVLHGNVAVDRQGRFVDIDGKALPGGVTVREYYRQLEQNIRDFAGEVKNLYRRLDAGEISAKEFLETIDSRPTMRLIEKLSLSPYSPLFVRYEKGAEYLYLHDVAEPDGYAYALQASDESGAFMDRVFDQFGAARDSAVLVIGHKSMVDGHVKTLANNRVLMVDPYFAKKRGAVGEDLDTGKGAGVVVGGSGVVTVALDPDRKGVGAATIDTEVVARRNLILSELPPDVPETYEGWKEMVSNARKNNVLFKNPLLQAINNLNARLKSVLSLPEPAYCIEQAI